MKEYTKHYEKTRREDLNSQFDEQVAVPVAGTEVERAGGRNAPPAFSTADSTKTHVLTSEIQEWKDNYIENAFLEWELWLTDHGLRRLQRRHHDPFTPTDWETHGL